MKGTHAKYGSFAYSSAFAYSVPPGLFTLEQYALASQLGLSDDGGEFWKTRRLSEYAAIETRKTPENEASPVLVSRWRPFPDVLVKTYLVPPTAAAPNWHIRAHYVTAGREVMTADGGFAVANERALDGRYLDLYDAAADPPEGTSPKLIGNYDNDTPEAWAPGAEGAFAVCARAGASGVRALEGVEAGRRAMLVNADPNSNLAEKRTTIPTLQGTLAKGTATWYVSGVFARPSAEGVMPKDLLDGWKSGLEIPAWLKEEMETKTDL
jgi:hypothetical protein